MNNAKGSEGGLGERIIHRSTYQVAPRAICPHGEGLPGASLPVSQDGCTGAADEAPHRGLGGHCVDAGLRGVLVEDGVKAVRLAIVRQVELQQSKNLPRTKHTCYLRWRIQ